MDQHDLTRRDFQKLAAAAFGGSLLGVGLAGQALGEDKKDEKKTLLGEPHVCRGLNTCKGLSKSKDNTCAGTGACATAEVHTCKGDNKCKGQGGCGEHPGENSCKAMGACEIPLKDKTWTAARKRFEELMTKEGKKFGDAPKKK